VSLVIPRKLTPVGPLCHVTGAAAKISEGGGGVVDEEESL
jgi:hypothetical protein